MEEHIALRPNTGRRARGRALAAGACAALLAAVLGGAAPVQEGRAGTERVEAARSAVEKMVATRRLISREKLDWALGKEMLDDRIELVQREIESLRARIAEAQESIAEADEKRAELIAENERLKGASAVLAGIVGGLEQRTRSLVARLPGPLVERVERLSQRIPADPESTKLSLSERFLNVVGILNESNRFNREITPTSEVRTLVDGRSAEVTALYVGLGQAYFTTAKGDAAGVGTAGEEGWAWAPVDASAPAVAEAVSVLEGERPAAFVRLPIRVQ